MTCGLAATAALASALLLIAATLVPAPALALPFLVAVCIGFPLAAAWELPASLRVLRPRAPLATVIPDQGDDEAMSDMRQGRDDLPEIEHPFGY